MRLFVTHHTAYAYTAPTQYAIQYVRLTPRNDPSQRTVAWTLRAPGRATPWKDGFGNLVHTVVHDARHDRLEIDVDGEVETTGTHGILPVASDELPPAVFLAVTPLTGAPESVRTFAAQFLPLRARGDLAFLHALMGAIHNTVAYVPGDTHVHSNAAEALEQKAGVCQDHAHLFIACCRWAGIPSRYVSGYLHTSAADGRHLATHAWAEALVEDLGWVSFDPSNCQSATHAYIRLAVAFDYQGAAPVRGIRLGGGEEAMSVRVLVQQVQEQQ
ncbi:MAG: transglutaminase family protein [Magnetospirillum sp.]|nr:transglutaminase family protein [Magnetospirillum sp.]